MPNRPARYQPPGHTPAEQARPHAAARGYGWQWQQYARRFLEQHPLCAACQHEGRTTAATCVDHITPHRGDATRFWDPHNHQPLCDRCHAAKTARGQ